MRQNDFNRKMKSVLEEIELEKEEQVESDYQEFLKSGRLEEYKPDETFRKKVLSIAAGQDHKEKRRDGIYLSRKVATILGCVFFILSTTVVIQAVGYHYLDFFETTSYTEIRISEEFRDAYIKYATTSKVYFPEYVPDGYALDKIEDNASFIRTIFKNSENLLTISQMRVHDAAMFLNTENVESEKISINGKEGLYACTDGISTLTFYLDDWYLMIIGSIDKKECIKIAESMA